MCFHPMTHAVSLKHKSDIHKVFKFLRNDIITFHIGTYQVITNTAFLMPIHHFRFNLIVFRNSKCSNRLHFRERLETKFTHKSR